MKIRILLREKNRNSVEINRRYRSDRLFLTIKRYRWLFLGNRFWILFLGKSVKEEVYPDSKILSRELRKVSREAKQEIKKAESNQKNSKKMFKILNKNFTPSKLSKSHSCKLIIAVYCSFIMNHCDIIISGLNLNDYYLSTKIITP